MCPEDEEILLKSSFKYIHISYMTLSHLFKVQVVCFYFEFRLNILIWEISLRLFGKHKKFISLKYYKKLILNAYATIFSGEKHQCFPLKLCNFCLAIHTHTYMYIGISRPFASPFWVLPFFCRTNFKQAAKYKIILLNKM